MTQNGEPASASDLQPGSQVLASYNVQQGQAVAIRVDVKSPMANPGAANPSPQRTTSSSENPGGPSPTYPSPGSAGSGQP